MIAPRLPDPAEFARYLRTETVGGTVLLGATAVALIWANSPLAGAYEGLRDTVVGPAALHLDLTLAQWATDGLLALFFFVVGLELKRELVVGELSRPSSQALLPVAAALGGMIVPPRCRAGRRRGARRAWTRPGRSRSPPTSPSPSGCSR